MKAYKLFLLIFVLAVISACNNPLQPYDAIYMTEAQVDISKMMTVDVTPGTTSFTVSSSVKASEDIQIEVAVAPEQISSFNKKYRKNYIIAPEKSFTLSSLKTMIKAGHNVSLPINLTINSRSEFKEGVTYCIPVTIRFASSMKILEPSKTLFIVLKLPIISKAIFLGNNIYTVDAFKKDNSLTALKQVSMEAKVYVKKFAGWDPYISSIMGIEGIFGMRFGDVKISPNTLQVCHESYQPAAEGKGLDTDKWYHVAAVWTGEAFNIYINGQFATGVPVAGETINLASDNSGGFYLGASYGGGRPIQGYIAEARVWTRALTPSEILNNMNYVDPKSEGLLAYWRMNKYEKNKSGHGNIVKDETGHGYDAYGRDDTPEMIDTKW